MLPLLSAVGADPSRVYTEALHARAVVEHARELLADAVGARAREVVFTSGGTEAANAAVHGALARSDHRPPHAVIGVAEHAATRDPAAAAAADLTLVSIDGKGHYSASAFANAVHPETALVCIQLVNHEVGAIQPVAETIAAVRERSDALVCVDACAAFGHVPVGFKALDADLMTISSHKIGGPQGVGALLIRRGLRIEPFVVGGAQERARRAGIESVAAIAGFGVAAAAARADLGAAAIRERALIDTIVAAATAVPGASLVGEPTTAAPHIAAFVIDGVEAEPILLGLDQRGVSVHSGSSCSSETLEPSPVLAAMGVATDQSLRVSVGWSSTAADAEAFGLAFAAVVEQLRALRST